VKILIVTRYKDSLIKFALKYCGKRDGSAMSCIQSTNINKSSAKINVRTSMSDTDFSEDEYLPLKYPSSGKFAEKISSFKISRKRFDRSRTIKRICIFWKC
jgi:hypothetical protein